MPASPYFDRTYFDPTYFDADSAPSGGRGPKVVVLLPEEPTLLDEELLEWII